MNVNNVNAGNIGKCVDFRWVHNPIRHGDPEPIIMEEHGWKIIDIHVADKLFDNNVPVRFYKVRSDFGNGNEEKIILPDKILKIYDCPPKQMNVNNNENMNGGRKKSRKTRKQKKSRKIRKGRKH